MHTTKKITLSLALFFTAISITANENPQPLKKLFTQQERLEKQLQPLLKKAARRSWPLSARFVTVGLTALLLVAHQDEFTQQCKYALQKLQEFIGEPKTAAQKDSGTKDV